MMPLIVADKGKEYKILKIGGNAEVRQHLADLGFVVGGSVCVISEAAGNLIVNVKESRVGIGKDLAMKIMI
ncbi:MAG: FeoA domain-containing protein [Erysipelotrichaceae bacterium]|jgi:ferrous iron transport protein A|nr:FeoA domain-containing protein [Erysipelotrichaceae bacterium]